MTWQPLGRCALSQLCVCGRAARAVTCVARSLMRCNRAHRRPMTNMMITPFYGPSRSFAAPPHRGRRAGIYWAVPVLQEGRACSIPEVNTARRAAFPSCPAWTCCLTHHVTLTAAVRGPSTKACGRVHVRVLLRLLAPGCADADSLHFWRLDARTDASATRLSASSLCAHKGQAMIL